MNGAPAVFYAIGVLAFLEVVMRFYLRLSYRFVPVAPIICLTCYTVAVFILIFALPGIFIGTQFVKDAAAPGLGGYFLMIGIREYKRVGYLR